jgi:hypothetical protein
LPPIINYILMANKPRVPNHDVLVVDTGVPINVSGTPAVVLRREAKTLQELKQGRLALRPRQAGFARTERCLLYRDEEANYHYLFNSDALKDQLYIKNPVASLEYLPNTDLTGTLRYLYSKDEYYVFTEKEDGNKEWVPVTAHTDTRLDEEINRAIARENKIEGKAQGINAEDNGNGSFTFTSYDGNKKIIQSGKRVQSADGTVEVTENADNFDLSIQKEIDRVETKAQGIGVTDNQDGTFSLTDYSGETETVNPNPDLLVASDAMETMATPTALSIVGKWTNLRSRLKTPLSLNVPASNDNQTGVMTGEDHSALTKAVADIIELWALVRSGTGRVVITQLPSNPTQQDISDAFNLVYQGNIYDKDTVIDTSNGGFEWIHSNSTWINLTEQPIPVATNTTLGLVKGDAQDGKVYVELDGTQSVYGWGDLKTAVGNIASKINANYAYGASVSGNTLTINFRNIFTGSETATAIDLPNAFTNVSYSGNTLTFTKADGTTQAQAITLTIDDVASLDDALAGKQNKLVAGTNITITGNTISATGSNIPTPISIVNGGTNASNTRSALDNLGIILGSDGNAISIVTSSTNWNDCRKTGFYTVQIDSQNANLNSPITSGGHWGTLLVMCHRNNIGSNTYPINQIYFRDNGDVWVRGTWNSSSWVTPSGTLGGASVAGANGLWRRWQAGNAANTQLVRGDGSLMYRARGYALIIGTGIVPEKTAQIRWKVSGDQVLTIDSREYLEGDVVDVYMNNTNDTLGRQVKGINNSGSTVDIGKIGACISYTMNRFVKASSNLEYLCSWTLSQYVAL